MHRLLFSRATAVLLTLSLGIPFSTYSAVEPTASPKFLALYQLQTLMLRNASFHNSEPHRIMIYHYRSMEPSLGFLIGDGFAVLGRIGSAPHQPRRIENKDILFFSGLLVLFVCGTVWDFHHLHALTLKDPRWEILGALAISELSAGLASVASQWITLKKESHLSFGHFQWRPVFSFLGTGVYSAVVERFLYVWALPWALNSLRLPSGATGLIGAIVDLLFFSPYLMERLAYYVNSRLEGSTDEETLAHLRENGVEIYAYAAPVWFLTTLFSLLSRNPMIRFAWISVGTLLWSLVFTLKAGRPARNFLTQWSRHPVLRLFVPYLKHVQRNYANSRPSTLKKWLLVLGVGSLLKELVLWQVPLLVILIAAAGAGVGLALKSKWRMPRVWALFAAALTFITLSPFVQAADFAGEVCQQCHALIRDRAGLDLKDVRVDPHLYESIVAGGGPSGLMAGYELWRKHYDVQVLEKNAQAGGHATSVELWGRRYSPAAVYMNEPQGWIKSLFHKLGIAPTKIADPMDAVSLHGKVVFNFWENTDELPYPPATKMHFLKLKQALEKMNREGLFEQIHWKDPRSAALASVSFDEYLREQYDNDDVLLHFGEMFARDMFGGSAGISAREALRFLRDEVLKDSYTFNDEHGLGPISNALAKALGDRVKNQSTVIHVAEENGLVSVVYQDGEGHFVLEKSRTAVVATPAQITRRIVAGMPVNKKRAFDGLQMSTYLVVFVHFRKTVWDKSYSLWSDPLDPDTVATEITFPDWKNPRADGTQVGVLYMPMGTQARPRLATMSDADIFSKAERDLEKLLPGAAALVASHQVFQWPHAMEQPGVAYPTQLLAQPFGHLTFAGEGTAGEPLIEESLAAGRRAAHEAEKDLRQLRRRSGRLRSAV